MDERGKKKGSSATVVVGDDGRRRRRGEEVRGKERMSEIRERKKDNDGKVDRCDARKKRGVRMDGYTNVRAKREKESERGSQTSDRERGEREERGKRR